MQAAGISFLTPYVVRADRVEFPRLDSFTTQPLDAALAGLTTLDRAQLPPHLVALMGDSVPESVDAAFRDYEVSWNNAAGALELRIGRELDASVAWPSARRELQLEGEDG